MANEVASGGTITVDTPTLVEHTFTAGGTFSLDLPGTLPVDYLVQGAGSSGSPGTSGVWYGGGGAGGQAKTGTALDVSSNQTVTIGVGGAGVSGNGTDGLPGGSSLFGAITATGGAGQDASTGVGASNDDFSGGAAGPSTDAGGGAGSGENGNSSPSTGGDGVLWNGTRTGGGGGGVTSAVGQAGGLGGGGAGNTTNGVAGTANSGGGGGGTSAAGTSGAGGSGKVVVRYDPTDFLPTISPVSVDAVADVPPVTVTPRGRTIPLTAAVDAIGDVPAVTVLAGTIISLTDAVDAVAGVPAVVVDAAGKHVGLTSVAAVGGVPTVSVASASSVVIADAVDAVAAVPAVVLSTSGPPVAAVAVAAISTVPAVLVVANALDIETISAPGVVGPYIQEGAIDDEMEVESIPRSSMATGPLWIANDDSAAFKATITAELFEEDGVTPVAGDLLANAFNHAWLDELNGPGYGTFDIPMSETAAVAALTLHRLVRCSIAYSETPGAPAVEAFCWQIEEHPQIVNIDPSEEHGQIMRVRGRGWAVVLDEAIVYPPIPVGETATDLTSPFLGPDRVFSFASPDYPDLWGSPADWPLVKSADRYETLHPERFDRVETYEGVWENLPAPVGFPWPNSEVFPNIIDPAQNAAYWIWPSVNAYQAGWAFFIGDFYPHGWQGTDPYRPITWTTTADNLFTFFIDGTPLLGESLDTFMWKGWKEFTQGPTQLRTYRIACAVRNIPSVKPNAAGWLMAATYADDGGNIEDWALTTNGAWRGYYSPSVWPGWTAGQIMIKLLDETNTRASGTPQHTLNYDFGETAGSNGDSWAITIDGQSTLQIPWLQVSLGSTYLETLDQLHQDGWVNWRMSCAGLVLQMWSYDSATYNTLVSYAPGSNIVSLERAADQQFANVLLVSYEGGYVEVQADSVATDGRHEDVLRSDATDEAEAIRIGGHELAHRALDVEGGAIVMEIEPVDDSDTPYLAYLPGDGVNLPSLEGAVQVVTNIDVAVGVATATLAGHGYSTGDLIAIYDTGVWELNGGYSITVSDPSTFSFIVPAVGADVYTGLTGLAQTMALVRVMSISVKQDGMGDPKFILELNKRWPVQERDTNRLLRSIGGKSLGSAGTRGKVT